MSALTEIEIFSSLAENFRLAAEHSDALAREWRKGPHYDALRTALARIEGGCRQAAAWRGDTRWLVLADLAAQSHHKAGGWLRGYKTKTGIHIMWAPGIINPLFEMLAENMRAAQKLAEQLRDRATGRVGPILPEVMPLPGVRHRPVSMGGLIIP